MASPVSFNWFSFFFKKQHFQNSIRLGMVKNNHSVDVLPFNHYFISLKNVFVRLLTYQTHVVSLRWRSTIFLKENVLKATWFAALTPLMPMAARSFVSGNQTALVSTLRSLWANVSWITPLSKNKKINWRQTMITFIEEPR